MELEWNDFEVTLKDGILEVALDRPRVRNALTNQMLADFDNILDAAEADPGVKAVVLAGNGSAFCAGHDLTESIDAYLAGASSSRPIARALPRSWYFSKPLIGAVQGYVGPGGFEITAACDFIIASEDARWSYEGTRAGGTAPNGAYLILSFQLPMRVMNKLYMMGGWFTASDAVGWDFVQRVVPVEEVRSEAKRWAEQAGKIPLLQYSAAKTSLRRVYEISGLSAAVGAQNMVSGHGSDSDLEFRQAVRDKGLSAALRDRGNGFDQDIARV